MCVISYERSAKLHLQFCESNKLKIEILLVADLFCEMQRIFAFQWLCLHREFKLWPIFQIRPKLLRSLAVKHLVRTLALGQTSYFNDLI